MRPQPLWRRLLGWTVMVVAVGTGIGTTWFIYRAGAGTPASPPESAPAPAAAPAVVCLGYVDVPGGVASLFSTQPGRVTAVLVEENQEVTRGTELLKLDDRQAKIQLAKAEAAYQAARVRLAQADKLPEQKEARRTQQLAAIDAAAKRVAAARQLLEQKEALAARNLINAHEMEAARQQVKEAEAGERAERARLTEIELQDPASEKQRAAEEVKTYQAQRDEAQLALDECKIVAPGDGTVLRILVSKGDMVAAQARQPAVLFCPKGPRIIRAEVEQEFAPRVKVGMAATVEDDVVAGLRWRGKVVQVADWYAPRRSSKTEPDRISDVRTVECLVTVEPSSEPLRIGQRVRVMVGRLGQ